MCKRQYPKNGGQKIKESKDRHSDSIFVDNCVMHLPWHEGYERLSGTFPWLILRNEEEIENLYRKSHFVFANSPDGGLGRSLSCFWVWWLLSALFSIAKILLLLFPRVIRPTLSCIYIPERMLVARRKTAAIRLCFWVWRIIRLVSQWRIGNFLTNKTKFEEEEKKRAWKGPA